MNVISDFGFKVGAAFGAGMAKGMSSSGNVVGQANNKNNAASAEVIEEDMKIASEMAANMNVGSDSIMDSVDRMAIGAKYLDDVWKGDTKETFMEELAELAKLIKKNSDDLQKLGKTIEMRNKITEEQKNEDYKDAEVLYNKSN
jgi:hypothetical protein